MASKLAERWNFHYVSPEGHILYPFRHLVTYSYLLDTDSAGDRSFHVNITDLQHRVLASSDLFATWLAQLEQDGILLEDNKGVLSDKYFVEAKRLIDDRYAPHLELFNTYTGHAIIDLIHSSSKKNASLLTDIFEGVLRQAFGLLPVRLQPTIIELQCKKYMWTLWIDVFTSKTQIQSTEHIVESMKIMKRFISANPSYSTYYVACGPAFGTRFSSIAKGELYLLWSLSVINFVRELLTLPTEFSADQIQACFPKFFIGQEGKIAHSTSEGFSNLKTCISGTS